MPRDVKLTLLRGTGEPSETINGSLEDDELEALQSYCLYLQDLKSTRLARDGLRPGLSINWKQGV